MASQYPRLLSRRDLLPRLGAAAVCGALSPALAEVPLTRDRRGRLTVPAHVEGRGPFKFMLDTGAEMSAISAFLARELRLEQTVGAERAVHGVVSAGLRSTVNVRELRCDALTSRAQNLLVLDGAQMDGIDGLLGADVLQHCRLDLDIKNLRASFQPVAESSAPFSGRRLRLTKVADGLIALQVQVGRVRALALHDSGATHTIGNLALRQALGVRAAPDPTLDAVIIDSVSGQLSAIVADAPTMTIGQHALPSAPMRFADLAVFSARGLRHRPTLLLGLDRLSLLAATRIDYPRRNLILAD